MRYLFFSCCARSLLIGSLLFLFLLLAGCEVIEPSSRSSAPSGQPSHPETLPPTPTLPPPPELLERALEQRTIEDDHSAAHDFRALLDTYPTTPEARYARYYLAESFARRERWTSAIAALRDFVDSPVEDELTPRALFWLARAYEETGDWGSASETYARYRAFNTPLEPYAAIRQAAQQQALGDHASAARNYEHGAASDIDAAQRAASYEKAIAIHCKSGNQSRALQLYKDLLGFASLPAYRARMLAEAAALAESMGQTELSRSWLHEVVTTAPETSQALNAVETLREAGSAALLPAEAARVYVVHEHYTTALQLFDEALAQTSAEDVSSETLELRRLRAMTLRALGHFSESLDALAFVGNAAPNSEAGRQARLDWIQTLGQSGSTREAADAYYDYAEGYPDDPRAPTALDRAAQLLDRLGNYDEALQVRLELEHRYPDNPFSAGALHAVALARFRAERFGEAQDIWQQLAHGREGSWSAAGSFWAARVAQRQHEKKQARALFEAAYNTAPRSYYGARAAEELGLSPQPTIQPGDPITEAEWRTLESWIAGWRPEQPDDAASEQEDVSFPTIETSGCVQRAVALSEVGLYHEAIAEWNNARNQWEADPARLMQLARLAHEHTFPYIALKAAEQIERLAPPEALPSPLVLQRLIFPTPYTDLVLAESRAHAIDPRMLYALMRQESLFNPYATSWVGARGLGQVMPATGRGIAAQLGITDFDIDNLYHPYISVKFGAYYIGQQVEMMNGSVQGGLSAYNGGPGNAQRWADGTRVADPDLFTEGIDYNETRNYVRLVYGYYGVYRELYTLP